MQKTFLVINRQSPFISYFLIKKINKIINQKLQKNFKIWSRSSLITPLFVNCMFMIYNGKKHFPLFISQNIINHKFGEFILTRKFISHIKTNKKLTHTAIKKK